MTRLRRFLPLGWLAVGAVHPSYVAAKSCAPLDAPSSDRVAAHLQRARNLLATPGTWTQNAYARDGAGQTVDSQCSTAGRFCCSGALYATQGAGDRTVMARILLARAIGNDIEIWNDAAGRQPADVLAAFDRAIALALAAPPPMAGHSD